METSKESLLTNLPAEILIEILSRLHIGSIMSCKCVCKLLLHLVETPEFVNNHLSKSQLSTGVVVHHLDELWKPYMILECVDSLGFNRIYRFFLPREIQHRYMMWIIGSVNGLVLWWCLFDTHCTHVISNPITRDYIMTPPPPLPPQWPDLGLSCNFITGFGVSKMSSKYKIVKIYKDVEICHVYTVGGSAWRVVNVAGNQAMPFNYGLVFARGNLHWLVYDNFPETAGDRDVRICGFDLETEVATYFPPPTLGVKYNWTLCAMEGELCICDGSRRGEIVIWLMKEHGWTKRLCVNNLQVEAGPLMSAWDDCRHSPCTRCKSPLVALNIFKDGGVLIGRISGHEIYWHSTNLASQGRMLMLMPPPSFGDEIYPRVARAVAYTPTFLSLKSFVT